MDRNELLAYAAETYGVEPEYPWKRLPTFGVLRHPENKKWFGLVASVERSRLGLPGTDVVDVLNVKGDPVMNASLRNGTSILPGYHMNHESWLTVLLDGSLGEEEVFALLDQSFEITLPKKKRAAQAARGPREWLVPANPHMYDIEAAFALSDVIHWKQTSDIRPGDPVYLYVGAPVSAIRYQCVAVETDLPRPGEPEGSHVRRMWIRLIRRYPDDRYPLSRLREYGVLTVRGPRGIPYGLSRLLAEENREREEDRKGDRKGDRERNRKGDPETDGEKTREE